MSLAMAGLPGDPGALRAFALACQGELKAARAAVRIKALEIEKLRFQIAKLRRMQFGRSSGRITGQIAQLELQLEELETGEAEDIARTEASGVDAPAPERRKPKRKPLPDHLPRHAVLHQPPGDAACVCPSCGGGMGALGEDVTEVLDYVPGREVLSRFVTDGRLEIDNNIAENAMRCIAVGRKNYLFAGSDSGGERAAPIYTIVRTAKLNGLNPETYLRDLLTKIAEGHTINKIDTLLPWNIEPQT